MKSLSFLSVALFATASLAFAPTATAEPNYPAFCKDVNETSNETSHDYTCSTGLWANCASTSHPGTVPPRPSDCRYCTSYSYHKNETMEQPEEKYDGCIALSI
jgi:hypothetical protein